MTDADRTIANRVFVNFAKALEAYQRQLVSRNAPFDKFVAGDIGMLATSEVRGLKLFVGKAGCVGCHSGPHLSDGLFHNIGVAQTGAHVPAADNGRFADITPLLASGMNVDSVFSDDRQSGRLTGLTATPPDDTKAAFRTPSLRGVAETGPYMHAGQLATLEDVVAFYDRGGDTPSAGTKEAADQAAVADVAGARRPGRVPAHAQRRCGARGAGDRHLGAVTKQWARSRSRPARGSAAVVAALAGCGGRAAAEADRVCTPLPAAATTGNQSTFPPPWPAEMASLAWGADHALYALGQWLQEGSVRRVLLRSTDLGTSFCVMPVARADGPVRGGRRIASHVRHHGHAHRPAQLPGLAQPGRGRDLAAYRSRAARSWRARSRWPASAPRASPCGSPTRPAAYWVSRDAGEYFERATLALPKSPEDGTLPSVLMTFLADPELPGRAFVTYLQLADDGIYYHGSTGPTTPASAGATSPPRNLDVFIEMALTRGSRLVLVGAERLWLSDDGGDSLARRHLHPDHHRSRSIGPGARHSGTWIRTARRRTASASTVATPGIRRRACRRATTRPASSSTTRRPARCWR